MTTENIDSDTARSVTGSSEGDQTGEVTRVQAPPVWRDLPDYPTIFDRVTALLDEGGLV